MLQRYEYLIDFSAKRVDYDAVHQDDSPSNSPVTSYLNSFDSIHMQDRLYPINRKYLFIESFFRFRSNDGSSGSFKYLIKYNCAQNL